MWYREKEISVSTGLFTQEPQKNVSVPPGLLLWLLPPQQIVVFAVQKEGNSSSLHIYVTIKGNFYIRKVDAKGERLDNNMAIMCRLHKSKRGPGA